jgi:hypothetical protein
VAKIALNLFGIGILALLINGHTTWLVEHNAAGFFTSIERLEQAGQINTEAATIFAMQVYRMVFIVALFGTVIDTLRIGWRLTKQLIGRSGAPSFPSSGAPSTG